MDLAQFEIVYKTYQSPLVNFAFFYLKNEQESIDLVQEVFMAIWEKKDTYPVTKNTKAYLMTSVKNRCLNLLTRKKIEQNSIDILEDIIISPDTTLLNMEAKQMESKIKTLINNLPEKCKVIFILSRFEHMSYKEIATLLDISVKTVENQIRNALKMLRKNLFTYLLLAISILQDIIKNV